ncbi:unnamed protein product [Withania somnifera]
MEIYSIRKERLRENKAVEYKRTSWDALRNCINGFMNKANAIHIQNVIPELFALVLKIPVIGDLLLTRLILQLKRRDNKSQLLASIKFIAHLVNQQDVHGLIALQLLTVFLEQPTEGRVEVAVSFVIECGSILQDLRPLGLNAIFERFRGTLHEGEIDKRIQFLIENLFAIRKAKFQGYPAVRPELDLKMILGEESEKGEDSDDESDEEEDEGQTEIKDETETETNLINLPRKIYQTIMSSVDFEEAGHKLLKIKLERGQEMELCMLLECCIYQNFDKCFVQQYSMIHHLETNRLRTVAKFFAHFLVTDALTWHVLAYLRLTEEDTTSSSRIFIKILFQDLAEHLGIRLLNDRLNDPIMQQTFESIPPKDHPKNARFAINFFTSIRLGGITENLRECLKNMSRHIMKKQKLVSLRPESESESSDCERDNHRRKRSRRT